MNSKKQKNISLVFGLAFLYWIVLTNVISVLLLFFGVSITKANFFIPLLMVSLFLYHELKENKLVFMYLLLFWGLLGFAICISGATFDHTWDGAAYHKTAIGLLHQGWNPLYQSGSYFNELSNTIKWPSPNPILWAEVYPKATWYFAAAIYKVTGNIETGKVYTIISVFILSGIIYNYLSYKKMKEWQRWVILLIAGANPIVLAQWQTFYLDGFVTCILLSLIFLFLTILDEDSNAAFKDYQWGIWALILIGCNLKWSVTLFVVTYCACFSLLYLWGDKQLLYDKIKNLIKTFFIGCFAVFILGFSPFITNLIRYGNLLEGFTNVIGNDNMAATFGISNLSNSQMFWSSIFGKMSHGAYSTISDLLKIPFTFSKQELVFYSIPDTRIGGFGIFFSGIFLLSIISTLLIFCKKEKKQKKMILTISFFYIVSFIEMMILPATFTARYVGQLYMIPIIAMIVLFMEENIKSRLAKITSFVLSFFIIANILPWFQISISNINEACDTKAVLNALSKEDDLDLEIAFYAYDFAGMHFNLMDYGINDYEYKEWTELDESSKLTYYNWMKYTN